MRRSIVLPFAAALAVAAIGFSGPLEPAFRARRDVDTHASTFFRVDQRLAGPWEHFAGAGRAGGTAKIQGWLR
jgi:hypothetical protein